jgi:uncharacterized protein YndB with AHSA1/START domain
MNTLSFTTQISAPRETVWRTLWEDATYRKWTAAFTEGSYAESDWMEGSTVRFLSPGGNGMYGVIEKSDPPAQMVFLHQGEITEGREVPKDWGGARERYFLQEGEGGTLLKVEVDVNETFSAYMTEVFPRALAILKELAEGA